MFDPVVASSRHALAERDVLAVREEVVAVIAAVDVTSDGSLDDVASEFECEGRSCNVGGQQGAATGGGWRCCPRSVWSCRPGAFWVQDWMPRPPRLLGRVAFIHWRGPTPKKLHRAPETNAFMSTDSARSSLVGQLERRGRGRRPSGCGTTFPRGVWLGGRAAELEHAKRLPPCERPS